MNISLVQTLMKDENELDCNIARIKKDDNVIIIINKENDTAIYDYLSFINNLNANNYLLFKHYENPTYAYKDFLKLIGKMCKKQKSSKYFMNHIEEDNRIVFEDFENEHMITKMERDTYKERFNKFISFVESNAKLIDVILES
jgi:hypothetical protein